MKDFHNYTNSLQKILASIIVSDSNGDNITTQDGIRKAIDYITIIKKKGYKIMIVGNGGSAAIASHFQNDLSKGSAIRAQVFTEQPLLTALSNDICYEAAYPEMVRLWAEKEEILFAISSSGKSDNIISSSKIAHEIGCQIITLSGFSPDNPLRKMGDLNFYVPSDQYGYVEICHTIIAHYISDCLLNQSLVI